MTERLKNVLANRKMLLSTAIVAVGVKGLFIGFAVVVALLLAGTARGQQPGARKGLDDLTGGSGRANEARPGVTIGRRSGPSKRIKSLYA